MTFILVSLLILVIGFIIIYLLNSSLPKNKRIFYSAICSLAIYCIVLFTPFKGLWNLALTFIVVGLIRALVDVLIPEVQ